MGQSGFGLRFSTILRLGTISDHSVSEYHLNGPTLRSRLGSLQPFFFNFIISDKTNHVFFFIRNNNIEQSVVLCVTSDP